MDKELTIQDLEAQADALLAAADEMEELLPADTGKSKRKKAEDEAPEKKAPPLDEKVLAGLPAAEQLQKSEKLRDLFAKGKQKGKLDSDEITEVLDELDLDDDGRERVYNSLDALGVDYISGVIEPDDLDEPPLEAIAEIEEEELVDPNDAGGQLLHRRSGAYVPQGDRQGSPALRRRGDRARDQDERKERRRGAHQGRRGVRRDHSRGGNGRAQKDNQGR